MSKKMLKLSILLLVFSLLLSTIVGCSKAQDETTQADQQQDATEQAEDKQQPEEEPEETEQEEPEEEIRDLGGRVIKVAAWWDMTPQGGTPSGDRQVARREEMEKKYNFKFEYVNIPWEEVTETYTASVMAGDPAADIFTVEDNWLPGLVNKGFVQPLDEFFDFSDDKWDSLTKELSTFDGKVYGMATGKWWPRAMMFYNKEIFARENLPDPYELMMNGEWTWEKMREIAKAATKDTDGDGVIDQWGIGGIDMDIGLIYSNGATFADIKDGKAVLNLRDPKVVEALNFYYELAHVDKSLYSKFTYGEEPPWDIAATMFQDGKIAMFWYQYWKIDDFKDNMADDYGLLLPPYGPSDPDKKYKPLVTGHNFQTIPKNVKNPEDVAFIWNLWTEPYPEDLEDPDAWMEAHYDRVREERSLEVLKYMYDNDCFAPVGLFGACQPAIEVWWGGQDDLLKGEKTVAQIIDEKFDALQAAFDDYLAN